MKKENTRYLDSGLTSFSRPVLVGALWGLIGVLVTSILASVMVTNSWLSTQSIGSITFFAMAIGGLLGGFIAGKLMGQKGMLIGILVGIIMVCVDFILGLLFQRVSFGLIDISRFMINLLELMLTGAIGGIAGINVSKR